MCLLYFIIFVIYFFVFLSCVFNIFYFVLLLGIFIILVIWCFILLCLLLYFIMCFIIIYVYFIYLDRKNPSPTPMGSKQQACTDQGPSSKLPASRPTSGPNSLPSCRTAHVDTLHLSTIAALCKSTCTNHTISQSYQPLYRHF